MRCRIIITLLLSCVLSFAHASSNPVPMLEKTANRMIKQLRQQRGRLRGNHNIAYRIVNRVFNSKSGCAFNVALCHSPQRVAASK